jgi:hypothetical protein
MARSFNGTTDQIVTASYALPAQGSLSVWYKAGGAGTTYQGIVDQLTTGAQLSIYQHVTGVPNAAYYVVTGSGTISVDPGSGTFTIGTWYHLACTYDSVGGLKTYFNGVSDGTAAANGAIPTSSCAMGIGFDPVNAGRNLGGILADAAEWNVVLSAGQIAQLAAGYRPVDVNSANLIGWWPLSGYSSPEPDISGNAHNGTLTGTSQAPMPPSLGRGGRNLNAGTNLMQNTSIVVPSFNGQSMASWIYATSLASAGNILRCTPGDAVQGLYITGSVSQMAFSGTLSVLATSSLNTNTWYHLAVTLNAAANNTILYLNGTSVASGNATDHLLLAGTKTLGVGYVGSANPLNGYVADQAFWTTELTSTDVANLYAGRRPNSIQSASLLTWWPCDGFSNATEPDRSGHGYDYTITGGVTPLLGPPQLWRLG